MEPSKKMPSSLFERLKRAYHKLAFWGATFGWGVAAVFYVILWPNPTMYTKAVDGRIYLDAARRWLSTGSPYAADAAFRQPAIWAIALTPLTLLPPPLDLQALGLLVAGALYAGVRLLQHALPGRRRPEGLYLLFTLGPLTILWTQQSVGMVFFFAALGLWLIARRRRWLAGGALGIAVGLKFQLAPVLLPMIALGGLPTGLAAAAGAAATFLLGTPVRAYLRTLQATGYTLTLRGLMKGGSLLWNTRYFVVDLVPGSGLGTHTTYVGAVPFGLGLALFCATALVYGVAAFRGWRHGHWGGALMAAALGFSLTPYSYYYDSVLLLPSVLLVARRKSLGLAMLLVWGHTLAYVAWRAWVTPTSRWPTAYPSIAPLLPLLIAGALYLTSPEPSDATA